MTLTILWLVLLCGWTVSEVLILMVTRTRRGSGDIRDRGSLLVLWPVIMASIWIGSWLGAISPHTIFGGAYWVWSASFVIFAAGVAVRWTAIATLGRSFSANVAIHATQTVHKTGLFRFVRHPSYSGMVLIFIAIGAHTRNWAALAILVVPTTAALLYRIHVEEEALVGAFGEEYVEYRRGTKRLVPGVY